MCPGYPLVFLLRKKLPRVNPRSVLERPVPGIPIPKVILVLPVLPAHHEVEISAPGHSILYYWILARKKAIAVVVYIPEGVHPYQGTVGVAVDPTLPGMTTSTDTEIARYPDTLLGLKKNLGSIPMRPVGT